MSGSYNEPIKEVISVLDEFKSLAQKKVSNKEELTDEELDRFCDLTKLILNRLLKYWWADDKGEDIADIIVNPH